MLKLKKKKIFFVLPSLTSGGAERVVSILSNSLSGMDYDVSIIVFNDKDKAYEIDNEVNIILAGKGISYNQRLNTIFKLVDLRSIIKLYPGAIVIPFHDSCLKYAIAATKGLNAKVIACERNDPYHLYPTQKSAEKIRHLYRKSDACVFQTKDARDFFNIKNSKKCYIIQNPVTQPYYTWEGNIKSGRLISVCRLSAQKNIYMAIDAVKKALKKGNLKLSYHIYGQGELLGELEDYVKREGMCDYVSFMGTTKNVQKELSTHSVFVLSSDYEGISNAMLEALSVGMPVISTDCPIGGARETITDGVNGILVPVGDSDALAESIIRLLSDERLAKEIGANAREIIDDNSVEAISQQWVNVIEGLC